MLVHPDYWNKRYKDAILESSASSANTSTIETDLPAGLEIRNDNAELGTYDWFRTWEHLETWFKKHLKTEPKQPRILHLGCGNSTLAADLHKLGFHDQTNIDFSEVVIRAMAAKYKDIGADWKVMDVRDMHEFGPECFDIAIDKGTMDAMFHGSVWDPPDEVRDNIARYLGEVDRVLVAGGTYIYITYRQPHFIRPLLVRDGVWKVEVEVLPDEPGGGVFEYFAYVVEKYKRDAEARI